MDFARVFDRVATQLEERGHLRQLPPPPLEAQRTRKRARGGEPFRLVP